MNFTDKRRRVKHVIRLAQRHYTCNKIEECQGDSKKTWQLINQVRGKQNKQIKPSFMINNERVICRRVIVHEFNKYFVSIASNLNEVYERRIDDLLLIQVKAISRRTAFYGFYDIYIICNKDLNSNLFL